MRAPVLTVALLAVVVAASVAALRPAAGGAGPLRSMGSCRVTQNHSITGSAKTTITFVNHTRSPAQLYWLDYKGHLVYYSTVAAGQKLAQVTFKTNPWLVLNSNYTCVGYVIAPRATYVIG